MLEPNASARFDPHRGVQREAIHVGARWTEGLELMQPGAVFRLTISAALGYGERGAGDVIPPNVTMVFTVALLAIADWPDPTPAAPARTGCSPSPLAL